MKELIQQIQKMVVDGEPNVMVPMLDLMALMASEIEEIKAESQRLKDSLGAAVTGGKVVPQRPPMGGSGGPNIG